MFVVFFDRPYYPSVIGEYDTREEAEAEAARKLKDNHEDNGEHDESVIYVAEIITKHHLKTAY